MPGRKPLGWPRYMVPRRLRSGAASYYWVIPTWAKKNGCTLNIEALGTDYADAKKRCDASPGCVGHLRLVSPLA